MIQMFRLLPVLFDIEKNDVSCEFSNFDLNSKSK